MAEKNHVDKQPENPRKAIREARERRLRVIDGPPRSIKVYAANERMREVLRHSNGTRFRAALDQGVEWPNDSFTKRRLAEGSVTLEPSTAEYVEPDPTKNPREHAAAQANASKAKQAREEKSEPRPASRSERPQPTPPAA
jgi:hypothetical protein